MCIRDSTGTVALLLTSDEEGAAIAAVRKVADVFRARGERIDWCICLLYTSRCV